MQSFCRINLFVFSLFLILSSPIQVVAQTDVTIGNGTTSNGDWEYPCPLPDAHGSVRMQFLYLASELTAAGMMPGNIDTIRFNVTDLGNYYDPALSRIENLSIRIGGTTTASLGTATWEPVSSIVYGPLNYMPVAGLNSFKLAVPFFWNGVDNIVIEMCTDGTQNLSTSGNRHVSWTTGLAFNGSHSMAELFTPMCNATGYSNTGSPTSRPNIIFNYTMAPPCAAGTLTGGTALTNKASVCIDEEFDLHLTGASLATGLSYQWQSSADQVNWSDISKATSAGVTLKQGATTWYRAVVSCASGGTATSAAVQVITPLPLSGTYTIDKTLSTGGNNFASFTEAYNFIRCGINGPVVFNVAPGSGTYEEQLILRKVPGASAANTITFNGNGQSIEYSASDSRERAVIKLDGADFFVFNDLNVNATGNYGYGFQLLNDADTNVINHCNITTNSSSFSANYAGIVVGGTTNSPTQLAAAFCDWNTFSNNTITGGNWGITLVGSTTQANGNNKIINNTIREFGGYGVYVACSFSTVVDNNLITRPARSEDYNTLYGIYVTQLNTRMSVSKNTLTHLYSSPAENATFYGIYFDAAVSVGGLENNVVNNLIYNVNGAGTVYGIYNNVSHNALYYHNTISLDGDGISVTPDKTVTGFFLSGGTGVRFFNNNITITRSGPATHTAIYLELPPGDLQSDRNNFYLTPGSGIRQTGFVNGLGRGLLSDWTAATGLDANSITADAQYIDLANGDLTPNNPALDQAGTDVGVTVDLKNTTRSNPPDIGALEFAPPPCTAPPVPGTVVLSVTGICVDSSIAISLTGHSFGATQTYQLESSSSETGPFSPVGNISRNPVFSVKASTTMWYRITSTCSGQSASTPAVQLTVYQAFPAGTYTINKNAAPSLTNFVSFKAAQEALDCGIAGPIVFDVAPNSGPYNEQLIFKPVKGASATNTITFNGNGNTLQFSSDNLEEKAVIKLRDADHFIFDSLVIDATGTGSYGFGIHLTKNADSNLVRKCTIITDVNSANDGYAGIVISANDVDMYATGNTWCDHNIFEKNTISGGYWGVSVAGDPVTFPGFSNFINDNQFTGNTVKDFYERGFYITGTDRTLIENNIISRPARTTIGSFYGIYCESSNGHLTVNRNRISDPFAGNTASTNSFYGVYTEFAGHESAANITNNLIYNINSNGTQYGIYANSSYGFNFFHNTISLESKTTPGNNTSATSGITMVGVGAPMGIKNNIVVITRSGAGLKYGFNVPNGDVVTLTIDKNNYYIKGAGGNNHVGYRNVPRTALADWQSATHKDQNSFSMDPVFFDPANGNFSPTIAPMNDLGEALGIAGDINNLPRNQNNPDLGAFEFSPTTCISGLSAGTAFANPASGICMGAVITLNLTGNTVSGNTTYLWQRSFNGTDDWQDISDTAYVSELKTEAIASAYYRCIVSCIGLRDTSTAAQVQLNAPMAGGVYTINNNGTGDYNSFNAAVAALQCGIAGHIIFDVAPGTYNERVAIRRIPGAADTARVTFRAANGDASSVVLTAAGTSSANYVLKLDSASYLTFANLSITNTSTTNARVVELAGTSSYDSLLNNIITGATTNTTSTARAAIFASPIKGDGIVIMGNTVNNGASGIYIAGTAINRNRNLVVAGNTVKGFFQYGIYNTFTTRTRITGNTVTMAAAVNSNAYGIYTADCDTGFVATGNTIQVNNTNTTVYGMYFLRGSGTLSYAGIVERNKVMALSGNTGNLYGIYASGSNYTRLVNNVVSIKTSGNNSYGLYSHNNIQAKIYNNTILSTATSGNINTVAYIGDDGNNNDLVYANLRNNIFSHEGGGTALYVADLSWSQLQRIYSDYNLLYTTGATLVQHGSTASYATLAEWQTGGNLDVNSIVHHPALVSATDLQPDLNSADVWVLHGRGEQITDNATDFNGQPRPVALKAGVPDLGAYEFEPGSVPAPTVAHPAAPAANTQQVFTLGTDTVAVINWGAAVPSNVTLRRYTGVKPNGLAPNTHHMYFYTDVEVTGGAYTYDIDQRYLDPWRGSIDNEARIRLGKTDNTGAWSIDKASSVNTISNSIAQSGLNFIDQFTGLTDPFVPYPPTDSVRNDTLNKGTRFWVGYGHNQFIDNWSIRMGGGDKDADVTIRIHGTNWFRNYHIPAHTFVTSDQIPRDGAAGANLITEGLSDRGISIESTEPIAAYAYADGGNIGAMGTTMLIPVSAYGFDYRSLSWSQPNLDINVHSWFYVIADHDSTMVEITPANPTLGGREKGVPFVVTLNRGEVYQLLGAVFTENECYDLSGSRVRAISNAQGHCYPIGVFSGNTRAFIDCSDNFVPFGNYLIQQNYPVSHWGTKYVTAPTSKHDDADLPQTNFYRVQVKDPATVVKRNGVALTGLINNSFYQYMSNTADLIEADQPVAIAQFIPGSSNDCDFGTTGPEIFNLPPLGQGIKQADFFRSAVGVANPNYLTVVIPTAGLNSLLVDGSNKFDSTYTHPNMPGYSVAVVRWTGADATSSIQSDSNFIALTYGGGMRSYGVTIGKAIITTPMRPGITNIYDSSGRFSAHNCLGTPFRYSVWLPVVPMQLTWKFSTATPGMVPDADSTQVAPTPTATEVYKSSTYYRFDLQKEYLFPAIGNYTVALEYVHPVIDNCEHTAVQYLTVKVVGTPVVDINAVTTGCVSDTVQFSATVTAEGGDAVDKLFWNFGDNSTSKLLTPSKLYAGGGDYNVKVDAITKVGCFATVTEPLQLKGPAVFEFVNDTVKACNNSSVTLGITNPETGVTYNWYAAVTGGAPVHTGSSRTINPVTAPVKYYVDAVKDGCTTKPRKEAVVELFPVMAAPVVRVDSTGTNQVRFAWTAVTGATAYQVSTDGGTTWVTPSGTLSHTVTGVNPGAAVKLIVKAIDPHACKDGIAAEITANTLPDQVFSPNAFSPNNDGLNDEFKIEGAVIRSIQLRVFNQWGELVFETADQNRGWDGRYKGKLQPSGVYMYVASITLYDGTKVVRKGAVNLVR